MELPAKIKCPHCGTTNEVNLLNLTGDHSLTCSGCNKLLLEDAEPIRVETQAVKAFMKETQRNVFRNIVLMFGLIFAIIVIVFVAFSTALNIPINREVLLLILAIFGAIIAVLLGFFWLLKKVFAIFE